MERTIKPGQIYKYYKGGLYKIVALAQHTETDEQMVVYQAVGGNKIWARPADNFLGKAGQAYRFEPRPKKTAAEMTANELLEDICDSFCRKNACGISREDFAQVCELCPVPKLEKMMDKWISVADKLPDPPEGGEEGINDAVERI